MEFERRFRRMRRLFDLAQAVLRFYGLHAGRHVVGSQRSESGGIAIGLDIISRAEENPGRERKQHSVLRRQAHYPAHRFDGLRQFAGGNAHFRNLPERCDFFPRRKRAGLRIRSVDPGLAAVGLPVFSRPGLRILA